MHDPLIWLAEQFGDGFASGLSLITGDSWHAGHPERPDAGSAPDLATWQFQTNLPDGAALWIAAVPPDSTSCGLAILRAAGMEAASQDDARKAFEEVLQQAVSRVADALTAALKSEISLAAGQALPVPADAPLVRVRIASPGAAFHLLLAAGAPLLARLAPPQPTATPQPSAPAQPKTIDLLLEVELPVGVSFGRAQMRLKDVIKLTTGSIVELNRTVSEPVEIIVNNCVIARGEVVVVEGNYGVRIRNIISREERLRTLF